MISVDCCRCLWTVEGVVLGWLNGDAEGVVEGSVGVVPEVGADEDVWGVAWERGEEVGVDGRREREGE